MGNKKRDEVLDMLFDMIIFNGPMKHSDLVKNSGLSSKTVREWAEFIVKVQGMPQLLISGDGRDLTYDLTTDYVENKLLENAIAFFHSSALQEFMGACDEQE